MFSSSWGDEPGLDGEGYVKGGGFDPSIAIWDSLLVKLQDDGNMVGTIQSNGFDYTYGINVINDQLN